MTFTKKEIGLLRQAVRIANEDGSLSGFASQEIIDKLADKLDRALTAATARTKE